jgi:hypothetical protein
MLISIKDPSLKAALTPGRIVRISPFNPSARKALMGSVTPSSE